MGLGVHLDRRTVVQAHYGEKPSNNVIHTQANCYFQHIIISNYMYSIMAKVAFPFKLCAENV